jgi:hypothetical protein
MGSCCSPFEMVLSGFSSGRVPVAGSGARLAPAVLAGADPVFDPGVATVTQLEQLHRAGRAGAVGDEHLMPQALDGVEQAEQGAGMRSFPPHDHPRSIRVDRQVNQVGDLGDLRSVTQFPVEAPQVDERLGLPGLRPGRLSTAARSASRTGDSASSSPTPPPASRKGERPDAVAARRAAVRPLGSVGWPWGTSM